MNFKIKGEYIDLLQLLKATGLAETGGHAKHIVDSGMVKLNGQPESRKRAKLRPGDKVTVGSDLIVLE